MSFGSIAELLLALFVLAKGGTQVVQAQITGSIIGTSLFGLGLAIVVGGIGREKQTFSSTKASLLSTLLILAVIALLLPAVFDYTGRLEGRSGHAHERQLCARSGRTVWSSRVSRGASRRTTCIRVGQPQLVNSLTASLLRSNSGSRAARWLMT